MSGVQLVIIEQLQCTTKMADCISSPKQMDKASILPLPMENDVLAALLPPSSHLPPAKHLSTVPLQDLRSCVAYLRVLYIPEVRGSRRRKEYSANGTLEIDYDHDEQRGKGAVKARIGDRLRATRLGEIRADAFERSHAIRWLTALVARADELTMLESGSNSLPHNGDDKNKMEMERNKLIEDAAGLLAACAGTAGSGRISRTYTFGPSPCDERVSITLIDEPLENGDYASVGAQTWGGACVMADMIFECPRQFDLPVPLDERSYDDRTVSEPFRILELGAGTGLVGIAIAKLMQLRNVRSHVVLSDFYPSVLDNLRSNVDANFPSSANSDQCVNISVTHLDWSSYFSDSTDGSELEERVSLGTFDLILGADIVYEAEHALWIKSCLKKLLRSKAYFHLVIPLRRTHTVESSTVEQVFGECGSSDNNTDNGPVLEIVERTKFSCEAFGGAPDPRFVLDRADDVEYAYYKIGRKGI